MDQSRVFYTTLYVPLENTNPPDLMKCISLLLIQKFSFRNGKRKENHSSADVIVSRNEQASICSSKYKAHKVLEEMQDRIRIAFET